MFHKLPLSYSLPRSITKLLLWGFPAIIISTFLVLSIVLAWTEPGSVPPEGNVPAPINVGGTGQTKSGALTISGGFESTGLTLLATSGVSKVGIGTTGPIAKLDILSATRSGTHPSAIKGLYVTGDFGAASDGVEFRHSNATQGIGFGYNTIYAAGTNANQNLNLMPKGTGNVGIGTASPGAKLEVAGTARMTGFQLGISATAGHVLTANASGIGTWQAPPSGVGGSGTATQVAFWSGATTLSSDSNLYWDNTNKRLGIGTASPGAKLDVSGTLRATDISLGGVTRSTWPFSGCERRMSSGALPANTYETFFAYCQSGEIATGGGFYWPHEPDLYKTALRDFHLLGFGSEHTIGGEERWYGYFYNGSTYNFTIQAYVNCCK